MTATAMLTTVISVPFRFLRFPKPISPSLADCLSYALGDFLRFPDVLKTEPFRIEDLFSLQLKMLVRYGENLKQQKVAGWKDFAETLGIGRRQERGER